MDEKNTVPEEDILIYDESTAIEKSRQKSRKVFVFYIVALFSVALVIILASYVVQSHQQQQLNEQIDVAEGAKSRAQKIQAQVDTLQEQVEDLQKQLQESGKLLEQSESEKKTAQDSVISKEKQIEALNMLWKLEKAYLQEDQTQAKKLVREMDRSYGRAVLTDKMAGLLQSDAAKEYQDICNALGV